MFRTWFFSFIVTSLTFLTLTEGILERKDSNRFLKTVQNLRNLKTGQLDKLNIEVRKSKLKQNNKRGIF